MPNFATKSIHRTILLAIALALFSPLYADNTETKPVQGMNVIFILTDDQRYDELGS